MPRWVYWAGLVLLTIGGAAIRAAWLDHPMRYDESWGFIYYILPRNPTDWLVYSAPNNHVLHTLLMALASAIGGDSPAVLRMPAFLAGAALVPATGHLAARLSGRRLAGLMAAALVAGLGILVEYSVNARGYTMLCLAAVVLTERTACMCRDVRPRGPWVAWAVIATAGLLTIPIMIYPMIVLALAIVLQAFLGPADRAARRLALRRTAWVLVASVLAAAVLYQPSIYLTGLVATENEPAAHGSPVAVYVTGLVALVANPFLAPRTVAQTAASLPVVFGEVGAIVNRDTSWAWQVVVGVGLLAVVVCGLFRRRAMYLLPLLLAAVLVGMMLLQRVVPFARVWLFAWPLLLTVAACGLVKLTGRIPAQRLRYLALGLVVAAVGCVAGAAGWRVSRLANLVSADIFAIPSRGDVCLLDARAIITDALELADGQTDVAWDYELPYWPPLAYYMVTLSSPSRHFIPYLDERCRRTLLVVPTGGSLQETLEHRPRLLQEYGPMQLWRSYPSAQVYLANRRPPVSSAQDP